MAQTKFHITYTDRRTTISVDTILSELMAIRLKQTPGTAEAHNAVRGWLQSTLIERLGEYSGGRSSQFAREYLILAIADKRLVDTWRDWQLDD